jgi:deoxyadenosine/deoxycytidine kinase
MDYDQLLRKVRSDVGGDWKTPNSTRSPQARTSIIAGTNKMKIVAVSGMIGTGKTTLARALSKLAGWPVVCEDVKKNRFLGPFYEDMERWALASQLSFMIEKTRSFETIREMKNAIVLVDRTLEEDFYVFGSVLKKYEIINEAEHQLLESIYDLLVKSWLPIDLHVYLEDTDENCFQRLLDRGNALESKVELGYVRSIGEEYRNWKSKSLNAPYYEIRTANLDFRTQSNAERVLESICALLKIGDVRDDKATSQM